MILTVCPNPSIDTYAWLENLRSGQSNRIHKLEEFPGGKATHIALALQELGQANSLMGNWAGTTGIWIQEECSKKGIRIAGISVEGQNRKCYTFRSKEPTFNNTELLEPGPTYREEDWITFKAEFSKEIKNHHLVCISGSWPKGTPDTAYRELVQVTKAAGKKIIIDCSGKQLENCLSENFFGIHINEQEANELFKGNTIENTIAQLASNVELIAITKGKEGLWLYYQGQLLHANVEIEGVISTVGAGDCLTAGIAYAVQNQLSIEQIAAYGIACGAANCLYEELGILEHQTVQRLLPKVVVKTLTLNKSNYAK